MYYICILYFFLGLVIKFMSLLCLALRSRAEFLNVSENWAELECQGDAAFKYLNWELSCVEWPRVAELIHV